MTILWTNLCRICSEDGSSHLDLFNDEGEPKVFVDLIRRYLSLKINNDDAFSQKLCNECGDKLTEIHNFACLCDKTQTIFHSHVHQTVLRDKYHLDSIKMEFKRNNTQEEHFNEAYFDDRHHEGNEENDYDENKSLHLISEIKEEYNSNGSTHTKQLSTQIKRDKQQNNTSSAFKREQKASKTEKMLEDFQQNNGFTCNICQEQCYDWKTLKLHMNKKHATTAKITCICLEQLSSMKSLLMHMAKHNLKKCVRCSLCSRVLASKKKLDLHMTTHMHKEEFPYVCCKCAKRFRRVRLLRSHEKIHLPREERYCFPCTLCEKRFVTQNVLDHHVKVIHQKLKPFICDICGHTSSSKTLIKNHFKWRHGVVKNFACERCPKKFKSKYALLRHKDTHEDTSYQCPHCAMWLNSRVTLAAHQIVHQEHYQYYCDYCSKAFKRKAYLQAHLRVHTGEKPVQCPWCPARFGYGSRCFDHKKNKHPEKYAEALKSSSKYRP